MSALRKRHDYEDGQEAEIARWPGVSFTRELRGKHIALVLTFRGVSRFVIYPSSPGDAYRGELNHLRDVREALKAIGAVREVRAKAATPARRRNRTEAARVFIEDRCTGGPKRDPWAVLATLRQPAPEPVKVPWWRAALNWLRGRA